MLLLVLVAVAVAVASAAASASASASAAPHIITIILDDVGWNDVGWRGGPMPTPAIDALSARGVRLERHYVHPVCTPSRMSLLTGKYSHLRHVGRMPRAMIAACKQRNVSKHHSLFIDKQNKIMGDSQCLKNMKIASQPLSIGTLIVLCIRPSAPQRVAERVHHHRTGALFAARGHAHAAQGAARARICGMSARPPDAIRF
jgi:hypothetical protein